MISVENVEQDGFNLVWKIELLIEKASDEVETIFDQFIKFKEKKLFEVVNAGRRQFMKI